METLENFMAVFNEIAKLKTEVDEIKTEVTEIRKNIDKEEIKQMIDDKTSELKRYFVLLK